MIAVALVGRGRIAGEVRDWLATAPGYRLAGIVGRGATDLPEAALSIDAAGPGALREHGERLLARGDLWTVGAAALADAAFADRLRAVARESGHRLRAFTGWVTGPALYPAGRPARLDIRQSAPGLAARPGEFFAGPLAEAVLRFPDHLNTATAAALAGPGLDATTIRLTCTPPGSPHLVHARYAMPGAVIETHVRLDVSAGGPHPVAQALIAALEARDAPLVYG